MFVHTRSVKHTRTARTAKQKPFLLADVATAVVGVVELLDHGISNVVQYGTYNLSDVIEKNNIRDQTLKCPRNVELHQIVRTRKHILGNVHRVTQTGVLALGQSRAISRTFALVGLQLGTGGDLRVYTGVHHRFEGTWGHVHRRSSFLPHTKRRINF